MSTANNTSTAKVHWTYWLHLAIGLGFMFLFPQLSPIEPITEVGMHVLGVFIGMVYLWSAVDSIWPSLLGLMLIAMCGYIPEQTGYAAVKTLFMNAFGSETVITVMLCMFLFAAVEYVGCTQYITRFFMTRKFLEGRPYVFAFILFFCSTIISGLTQALASLLILWPIAEDVCRKFGYQPGDKIFYTMICGIYLGATLGQPMLPFKGASYVVVSAFVNNFGTDVNYTAFIGYNIIMAIILLALFLVFVRLVIKPDVSGFKNMKVEDIMGEKLPKMNFQQKMIFATIIFFIVAMLIPSIMSKELALVKFLNNVGLTGILVFCLTVLMIIPYQGKPLLSLKGVAKKSFSWDVFFLVAAALYGCNALTNASTGIKPFLVQFLQPILGGHSDMVFVAIILTFAIVTTNFANNAGMATVVLPIVLAFTDQYPGIDPTVLCRTVCMIVFVAILTPAASPYCGMLHARKDLVSFKQIETLFLPMLFIALFTYIFVGYHIAGFLF